MVSRWVGEVVSSWMGEMASRWVGKVVSRWMGRWRRDGWVGVEIGEGAHALVVEV